MSSVLFNLNDMTLIMTIIMSTLFSVMLLSSHGMRNTSAYLLAAFMLAHALIATHELTFYGVEFRYEVINNAPNLLLLGSLAYCLDAILLYLYVKSVIYENFTLNRKSSVFLIPLVTYFCYLLVVYYQLAYSEQLELIENWQLASSWHFVTADTLLKILRLGFVVSALLLISKYHKRHKETRADISTIDLNWLKLLLLGFLIIISVDVVLCLIKVAQLFINIEQSILIAIGLSTYYSTFLLVVSLLFYSVTKSPSIVPISYHEVNDQTSEQSDFKPSYIEHIEQFMNNKKPYLNPDITIETLADDLKVSIKDLSVTLNRHFQVNFYEFINQYRINEAKALLEKNDNRPITEIFYEVGFNSKSVFYSFFKKKEGMTPTEYRKKFLLKDTE